MQTDIEVGCVVIGVPDAEDNCPNTNPDAHAIEDNTMVGKMYRVLSMEVIDGCVTMQLLGPSAGLYNWCIGCFRRVYPGKIPNYRVILEPV